MSDLEAIRKSGAFRGMPTTTRDTAIIAVIEAIAPRELANEVYLRDDAREIAAKGSVSGLWNWSEHEATFALKFPELLEAIEKIEHAKQNLKLVAASVLAELNGEHNEVV